MKAATLIVGGVFSYLAITFLVALEASNAAPVSASTSAIPISETARAELVSTSQSEVVMQCLTQN